MASGYSLGQSRILGKKSPFPIAGAPSLGNGQRSILLVGADRLGDPRSNLESVWLALYVPSNALITLIPVYPSQKDERLSETDPLPLAFKFDEEKRLDPVFLESLENRNLWWSGYIILDDYALEKFINFLKKAGDRDDPKFSTAFLTDLPSVKEDEQTALRSQTTALQELCRASSRLDASTDIASLLSLIPEHILTDLNEGEILAEANLLFSNGRSLTCEFPTLTITSSTR